MEEITIFMKTQEAPKSSPRAFFNSPKDSVQLIENIAQQIEPENREINHWYYSYAANHKQRLAMDLELVKQYFNSSSHILEFGSVPPVLTASIKSLKYDIKGIDIAPHRFASAIEKFELDVVSCNIEQQPLPFADNSFDGIIFNEIFEHLQNLLFVMREVKRVLKPGGTLLLSTPNLRSLNGLYNFLFNGKSYSCCEGIYNQYLKLETLGHMGHVREYTSREVVEFLHQIGLHPKQVIYRGKYKNQVKQILARLLVAPSLKPFMTIVAEKPQI